MSKFCVLMRRGFAAILAVLQEISAARTELAQGTEAKIRTQNFCKAPWQRDRSLRKKPRQRDRSLRKKPRQRDQSLRKKPQL